MIAKIDRWIETRQTTAAALERAALLSENRISKLRESGGRLLKAGEALRIARALQVPVDYLIDDQIDEPPKVQTPVPLSDGERALLRLGHRLGIDSSLELIAVTLAERGLAKQTGMSDEEFRRDAKIEPLPPRPRRKGRGQDSTPR